MAIQLDTPRAAQPSTPVPPISEPRGVERLTSTPPALGPYFWLAAHAPWLVRAIQPLATRLVPIVSTQVRVQTRKNAARIFGRTLHPAEQRAFTRSVVNHFYEFILDIGQSSNESVAQLFARIESVEGEAAYRALRAGGRGAVLVTAHMGSFEVGLAALTRAERRVHVVYKRDASVAFETIRARMRRTLGVIEAPIDDGLATWISLRDALRAGEVVVMQGDRAMPGQRSAVVPFLHGHLRVPTGAVRLAQLTGSPIVAVFTVRLASGRFAVHLSPAIEPGEPGSEIDAQAPSVLAVSRAIEEIVARYPTQWLVLNAAFEEDAQHA